MKINRNDPLRRRRSPLSTLIIIGALLFAGLLAASWVSGGRDATQRIEIAIPGNQIGH